MIRRRLLFLGLLALIIAPFATYFGYRAKVELATYHADLGGQAVGRGELDLAEREFKRALRLDARQHNARGALASLYEARGDHKAAIREFKAGQRADPQSLMANRGLADAHLGAAEYREALPAYQACVRIEPDNAFWWTLVGRCHAYLGDPRTARSEFEQALQLEPDNWAARLGLEQLKNGVFDRSAPPRPGATPVSELR